MNLQADALPEILGHETRNSQTGEIYAGDPRLIHIANGQRAEVGELTSLFMERVIRYEAHKSGARPFETSRDLTLCPGCYMMAAFDMLIALAQRNGQPLEELGSVMSQAFKTLQVAATYGESYDSLLRDKIDAIVDPVEASCPLIQAEAQEVAALVEDAWARERAEALQAVYA
jgi:hypothetical protein